MYDSSKEAVATGGVLGAHRKRSKDSRLFVRRALHECRSAHKPSEEPGQEEDDPAHYSSVSVRC